MGVNNLPNLNMKSNKYLFKKKLTLRRKSQKRLISESGLMFIFSILLVYFIYLVPNKISLFKELPTTLNKSYLLTLDLISYIFQFLLILFMLIAMICILILLMGAFYRIYRVFERGTRKSYD